MYISGQGKLLILVTYKLSSLADASTLPLCIYLANHSHSISISRRDAAGRKYKYGYYLRDRCRVTYTFHPDDLNFSAFLKSSLDL